MSYYWEFYKGHIIAVAAVVILAIIMLRGCASGDVDNSSKVEAYLQEATEYDAKAANELHKAKLDCVKEFGLDCDADDLTISEPIFGTFYCRIPGQESRKIVSVASKRAATVACEYQELAQKARDKAQELVVATSEASDAGNVAETADTATVPGKPADYKGFFWTIEAFAMALAAWVLACVIRPRWASAIAAIIVIVAMAAFARHLYQKADAYDQLSVDSLIAAKKVVIERYEPTAKVDDIGTYRWYDDNGDKYYQYYILKKPTETTGVRYVEGKTGNANVLEKHSISDADYAQFVDESIARSGLDGTPRFAAGIVIFGMLLVVLSEAVRFKYRL